MNTPRRSKLASDQLSTLTASVVGIVGGIGSGKSAVSAYLAAHGGLVLDADRAAHGLLENEHIKSQLRVAFGEDIFEPNGDVNRKALGQIVFGGEQSAAREREQLEAILHPRVREELARTAHAAEPTPKCFVLDAPLLLEAGWGDYCDHLLFVDAPEETRLERVASRGWTAEDLHRREAAQMSLSEKRRHATCIVDNSGALSALHGQLDALLPALCETTLPRDASPRRETSH